MTIKEFTENLDNTYDTSYIVYCNNIRWYFDFKRTMLEKFNENVIESWAIDWNDETIEIWVE